MPPHQWFRGIRIPAHEELTKLNLVSRDEWGALPPKEDVGESKKPAKTIVFAFNTNMETCVNREDCVTAVQQLQQRHMDLGYPDIVYSFVIGGDGYVYEGRGWDGKHPAIYPQWYSKTLIVGIIGKGKDEEGDWYHPYERMTLKLVKYGVENNLILEEKYIGETHEEVGEYKPDTTTFNKISPFFKEQINKPPWNRKK